MDQDSDAESSRIELRTIESSDLVCFYANQCDPVALRMADFPSRDEQVFLTHWERIIKDESVVARSVVVDGQVAGNVVCWTHEGKRLVGYWYGREFWGRGVATEALTKFLTIIDDRPLWALVAIHNLGSIRVLEKCGFVLDEVETETLSQSSHESNLKELPQERVYRLGPGKNSA